VPAVFVPTNSLRFLLSQRPCDGALHHLVTGQTESMGLDLILGNLNLQLEGFVVTPAAFAVCS
jgi:hypothetical protein